MINVEIISDLKNNSSEKDAIDEVIVSVDVRIMGEDMSYLEKLYMEKRI